METASDDRIQIARKWETLAIELGWDGMDVRLRLDDVCKK